LHICVEKITIVNSVVQYLHYLNKCHGYQRFNTSVEEISIYRDARISRSIMTILVLILCSLQLHRSTVDSYCTLHDSNKKAHRIKAFSNIS